jgi:hypothetical protein
MIRGQLERRSSPNIGTARNQAHVGQIGQADFGQCDPGPQSARRLDSTIHDADAIGQVTYVQPQFIRGFDQSFASAPSTVIQVHLAQCTAVEPEPQRSHLSSADNRGRTRRTSW